jgi:tol-pal system protein YbgF
MAFRPALVANSSDKALIVILSTSPRRTRPRVAHLLAGLLLAAAASPVLAQDTAPPEPAEAPAAEAAPPAPSADQGDPVAARIGRLEGQIHDLQVMLSALESLVKAKPDAVLPQEAPGANTAQAFNNGAGLGARVDALETQMGAVMSQLELMTQQLGAIDAKLGGGEASPPAPPPAQGEQPLPLPPGRQGLAPPDTAQPALAEAGGERGATQPSDRRQGLAALPPGADAASLYKEGYGDLLRRDYAGAETAFRQLVKHFPHDPLAGKAQYWLGESYYVRGEVKSAADAFLTGYKTYPDGEKAPDCLLRLGMTLAELGQKDAACSSLSEFTTRFPAADQQLRDEAKSELRKARC